MNLEGVGVSLIPKKTKKGAWSLVQCKDTVCVPSTLFDPHLAHPDPNTHA